MSPTVTAFWVDRDYDRAHASDDTSRYGAYLRDATFEPWTDHDQAVEWAAFAWRRATGSVMSPGYVRYHPQVLAAQLERSSWDGTLVPRFFSKGLFLYGTPITVPRAARPAAQEEARLRLEAELDRITDLADDTMGIPREPERPPAAA